MLLKEADVYLLSTWATVTDQPMHPTPCFLQSAHDASAAVPPQQQHYMPATYYGQYAQYPVYSYPQASYNVPTKFNAGYMYTPPAATGASTKGTQVCRILNTYCDGAWWGGGDGHVGAFVCCVLGVCGIQRCCVLLLYVCVCVCMHRCEPWGTCEHLSVS